MKLFRIIVISESCKHVVRRTQIGKKEQVLELNSALKDKPCPICQKPVTSTKIIWDDERYAVSDELIVQKIPDLFGKDFDPHDFELAKKQMELSGAEIPKPFHPQKEQIIQKLKKWGQEPDDRLIQQLMKPVKSELEILMERIYKCFPKELSDKLRLIPIGQRSEIIPNARTYPGGEGCTIPYITVNREFFEFIYDMTRIFLATMRVGEYFGDQLPDSQNIGTELTIDESAEHVKNICLRYFGLSSKRDRISLHETKRLFDVFLTPAQEAFGILHELAHALLHHTYEIQEDPENESKNKQGYFIYSRTAELEADLWAMNVLIGIVDGVKSPIDVHVQEVFSKLGKEMKPGTMPELYAAPIFLFVHLRILEQVQIIIARKYEVNNIDYFNKFIDHPPTFERIHQLEIQLISKNSIHAKNLAGQICNWSENIMAILRNEK